MPDNLAEMIEAYNATQAEQDARLRAIFRACYATGIRSATWSDNATPWRGMLPTGSATPRELTLAEQRACDNRHPTIVALA